MPTASRPTCATRSPREAPQAGRHPPTDTQIISGTWTEALANYVEPYDGDLADLLGRALPSDHPQLKSTPSASDRLVKALRELDHVVMAAERHLPRVAERQALPTVEDFNREQQARRDAERAARRLAQIGT